MHGAPVPVGTDGTVGAAVQPSDPPAQNEAMLLPELPGLVLETRPQQEAPDFGEWQPPGHELRGATTVQGTDAPPLREQDRLMPLSIVAKLMAKELPRNAKITRESKEAMQEMVSEIMLFISAEAMDISLAAGDRAMHVDSLAAACRALDLAEIADVLAASTRTSGAGMQPSTTTAQPGPFSPKASGAPFRDPVESDSDSSVLSRQGSGSRDSSFRSRQEQDPSTSRELSFCSRPESTRKCLRRDSLSGDVQPLIPPQEQESSMSKDWSFCSRQESSAPPCQESSVPSRRDWLSGDVQPRFPSQGVLCFHAGESSRSSSPLPARSRPNEGREAHAHVGMDRPRSLPASMDHIILELAFTEQDIVALQDVLQQQSQQQDLSLIHI